MSKKNRLPLDGGSLTEPQRRELMQRLCNVAASVLHLRICIDSIVEAGTSPVSIMSYSQLEWAPMDPIVYSAVANDVLQRLMLDMSARNAAKIAEQIGLNNEGHEGDDFVKPAEGKF